MPDRPYLAITATNTLIMTIGFEKYHCSALKWRVEAGFKINPNSDWIVLRQITVRHNA